MMRLSAPEQRLIDFAHEQFGEHLSQFLLTDLEEEAAGQRGRLTITYASGENAVLKRHVEVITYEPSDGSSYLPCARNPLVLIALLNLLISNDNGSLSTLRFNREELLNILGWKNTRKSNREIDEAVQRYFMLTYKWKMNKSELTRRKLRFYTSDVSLISESKILSEEGADGQLKPVISQIVFNEHFIEHLLSRSLFGIDWNSVKSLRSSSSRK